MFTQICMGLESIHHIKLGYRDLKPENMLLDFKGYIKITDFGFTKHVPNRTFTLCETSEYLAPEIIFMYAYGSSVDWWAFGIVIYEFVNGHTPFNQFVEDPIRMYSEICKCNYSMPNKFSPELGDLITNLLQLDVWNFENAVGDIKGYAWFQNIEWYKLFNQDIIAPYIPERVILKKSNIDNHQSLNFQISKDDKFTEFIDF